MRLNRGRGGGKKLLSSEAAGEGGIWGEPEGNEGGLEANVARPGLRGAGKGRPSPPLPLGSRPWADMKKGEGEGRRKRAAYPKRRGCADVRAPSNLRLKGRRSRRSAHSVITDTALGLGTPQLPSLLALSQSARPGYLLCALTPGARQGRYAGLTAQRSRAQIGRFTKYEPCAPRSTDRAVQLWLPSSAYVTQSSYFEAWSQLVHSSTAYQPHVADSAGVSHVTVRDVAMQTGV